MSNKATINTLPQGRTIADDGEVRRFRTTGENTNRNYALIIERRHTLMKKTTSNTRTPFQIGLAQPALRALANAGCDHLEQLARVSEADVRSWHGIGPDALKKLHAALSEMGLSFASSQTTDEGIGSYISQFPVKVQAVLEKVRETIREAAPYAEEVISYKMPAFKQHGILVYFAARRSHIGLYQPISGDMALVKAVAPYAGPKGNLQSRWTSRSPTS